jgi:signal transduction histidine kinase
MSFMSSALSSNAGPFGRVPFIRHLALCAAALVAYFAREELRVGNSVLWVFGFAALLNFQTSILSRRTGSTSIARFFSALFGLGGWTALMFLTGGVASPFIAGLSLEVILAAMTVPPAGIAIVTGGGVAGLWLQQSLLGLGGSVLAMTVHTGFLLVMGAGTGFVVHRWRRHEEHLARRQTELKGRLAVLERELDEAHSVGKMGENVARLAHGFKNAAHSLRGFAQLMEPRLSGSEVDREILDGLQGAIDSLEDLARVTLGPPGSSRQQGSGGDGTETGRIVREVVREVRSSFPGVQWSLVLAPVPPVVRAPTPVLREVLMIVVRNAAEAMQGRGEVLVAATTQGEHLEILVRDHGPGISEPDQESVFKLGYTTKPQGHGYGLFLARRLLEAQGGLLRMSAADGGGTLCRIELPLTQTQLAR